MCQSCFNSQWDLDTDDGDPLPDQVRHLETWLAQLPADRRAAIGACYQATVKAQSAPDWMGTLLHAAIDDDNYDCGGLTQTKRDEWRAERSGWNDRTPADVEDAACEAWSALDEWERPLVVAWRCSYWPFRPDPTEAAALPPERAGHLPRAPWDTPIDHRPPWEWEAAG